MLLLVYHIANGECSAIPKALVSIQIQTTDMGAYLRKMARDGYCIRLDLGDLKKVVSLMRYASNNLNQYAKKANETGSIYLEDIQDLQKRFDLIWEELKGIHTRLASIE